MIHMTLFSGVPLSSLDAALRPGELMLLSDHLNIAQRTPLLGEHGSERFVDLRDAYDPPLRRQAVAAAQRRGVVLHEGVYAWVLGPQFESPRNQVGPQRPFSALPTAR